MIATSRKDRALGPELSLRCSGVLTLPALLGLLAALLLSGCSSPCEVVCTRLAECNLLAQDVDSCTDRACPARLAPADRQGCASCLDTVACVDLGSCSAPGEPCPVDLTQASP